MLTFRKTSATAVFAAALAFSSFTAPAAFASTSDVVMGQTPAELSASSTPGTPGVEEGSSRTPGTPPHQASSVKPIVDKNEKCSFEFKGETLTYYRVQPNSWVYESRAEEGEVTLNAVEKERADWINEQIKQNPEFCSSKIAVDERLETCNFSYEGKRFEFARFGQGTWVENDAQRLKDLSGFSEKEEAQSKWINDRIAKNAEFCEQASSKHPNPDRDSSHTPNPDRDSSNTPGEQTSTNSGTAQAEYAQVRGVHANTGNNSIAGVMLALLAISTMGALAFVARRAAKR